MDKSSILTWFRVPFRFVVAWSTDTRISNRDIDYERNGLSNPIVTRLLSAWKRRRRPSRFQYLNVGAKGRKSNIYYQVY
jgi:hypothetical protein|tara:strand:+ start:322 stop:558 length:237 start_codon:yes stop_codon:yes gene_type:complete